MTLDLPSSPCSLLCLSCYLNLSGRNCLSSPPVLSAYNGFPDICFFRETTQRMSWSDGERYSCPPQFFVVFSPYLLYPLITFLGLEAYCFIEILQHTCSLGFQKHLQTLVPGHHSSHSALSSYELFAPLALWRLPVFLRPLFQALESFLVSSGPWSFAMPPFFGRARVSTTSNENNY